MYSILGVRFPGCHYRVFSHDITAAMLVSQNNEMVAMLVSQTSPVGDKILFLCKRILLCQQICIDAGHVSENTLHGELSIIKEAT